MPFSKKWKERGQIIVPAMFIFPALMLFVYLIYETTKLSREKIRHQFAADSAVFIDMTNYTDFLNRAAYVNGAFPTRIFWELLDPSNTGQNTCWNQNLGHNTLNPASNFGTTCTGGSTVEAFNQMLYEQNAGAFPYALDAGWNPGDSTRGGQGGQTDYASNWHGNKPWNIGFGGRRASLNSTDTPSPMGSVESSPPMPCNAGTDGCLELVDYQTLVNHWNVSDCDMEGGDIANVGNTIPPPPCPSGTGIMQAYTSVYNLLGQVATSQYQVLKSLEGAGGTPVFLQKSYLYNVIGSPDCSGLNGDAQSICNNEFNNANQSMNNAGPAFQSQENGLLNGVNFQCIQSLMFYEFTENNSSCKTYSWLGGAPHATYCLICHGPSQGVCGYPQNNSYNGGGSASCNGLFQLVTVPGTPLAAASVQQGTNLSPLLGGWTLNVKWSPPPNWFNWTPAHSPEVHSSVGIWCGPGVQDCGDKSSRVASVWPTPTPSFQARLYP